LSSAADYVILTQGETLPSFGLKGIHIWEY
jgi:hypothetical protein